MRFLMVPAIALAMAASPLALAQAQQTPGEPPMTAPSPGESQAQESPSEQAEQGMQAEPGAPSEQTAASPSGQTGESGAKSYDEVASALEDAGLQNVEVLNAAYLMRAQSKEGEQFSFVVEPPMTGAAGQSADQPQQAASQQKVRDALTEAGFQDIQFVDATYLAQAKTQDGDQITMMIDPSAPGGGQSASGAAGEQTGSTPTDSPATDSPASGSPSGTSD